MKNLLKSSLALLLALTLAFAPVFSTTGLAMESASVKTEEEEQAVLPATEEEQEELSDTVEEVQETEREDAQVPEGEESVKAASSPIAAAAAPAGWTTTKPSGSYVMVRGTPDSAVASGPLYGSELYYQVSPTANTNNHAFTIPAAELFFTLNPGWVLDYAYAGASQRQPGQTFLLNSSGGTIVYYFKRGTYTLTTQTAVDGTVTNTANQSVGYGSSASIAAVTTGFDTANYDYTFTGWSIVTGSGTFANQNSQSTTFTMGGSNTTVRANFTRTAKKYALSIQTVVDGTVISTVASGSYASGTGVTVKPDTASLPSGGSYIFKGWTRVSGAGTFANTAAETTTFTTGAAATVLKAEYEKEESYALTIETYVEGQMVSSDTQHYADGTTVQLEADTSGFDPEQYNYTFVGWIRASGVGSIADSMQEDTSFTTGNADTVLWALYTRTEKVVRAQVIVFFEDAETGLYSSFYVDELTGVGLHTITHDISKVPAGYELYPADQTADVTVYAHGTDDYINGYTLPALVSFKIMPELDPVAAGIQVQLVTYDTQDVVHEYTESLARGKNTVRPDASEMPAGYSAYPEHQMAEVNVANDGTKDVAGVIFYIAEENPAGTSTSVIVYYFSNVPGDAIPVSGNRSTMRIESATYYTGQRMPLDSNYDDSDPLILDKYEFIGWSTASSGDPLYTGSYIIPDNGLTTVILFGVWREIE